ncbi:CPBP family intramembrane glutamic endopeptidase [Methanosarcina sp. 2.H.A.1B.4]|uniref:CPBP family intramembrane glutamic endopeptidase n=1 Tax=Methanosarcina sp. 2.H.A.1B.4 TaxID=1483600 RepID=UPI0006216F61|nr:CPBP family intramembrane glutamic endopeptidase [Methanosarcina sp. 2.H.A.1B.4]KKG09429.1 CAAX protease [Methanosarcina sp. 2.H.A.1B.4]
MENPELPAENRENKSHKETENPDLASLFEEKKASFETEKQETTESGNPEIRNKEIYVGIPILAIAFAEMLIYSGRIKEAVWVHMVLLMGLSLSIPLMKNEEIRKTCQALMLLPLLRLVNLSMPVFFDITLYSFVFIYAPLAVPVAITAVYQRLTLEEVGITLRRIWLYFPFSVLIGAGLGVGEYMVIRTGYLIPDLSPLNLLKLTVVMVFFVGLVEEVIFRSVLQTRLNKIFGAWGGILLSSMLFGVMHSGYGTSYEVLYTSFVGVIIGYMFYKTRSLPLITMAHGFVNVFLFGVIPHLGPGLGLL